MIMLRVYHLLLFDITSPAPNPLHCISSSSKRELSFRDLDFYSATEVATNMRLFNLLMPTALATYASSQAIMGFNYGNQKADGSGLKVQADYENEFSTAKELAGTGGQFTSARLYTMLQSAPSTSPISAIPAAIATKTSLLFGLWASAGDNAFALELQALRNALSQYGPQLIDADLLLGVSVGSEDLYRNSPIGAGGNPGANPATIANYISQVRTVLIEASFSAIPVGHVDTWNAWVNASNNAVISEADFVGMNGFPYFQSTNDNTPANLAQLFAESLNDTIAVAQGKPVWVTETGFPVTGPTYNQAVPSNQTAHDYYHNVGCGLLFGQRNTWWYILEDAPPAGTTDPDPAFGLLGYPGAVEPLYDLRCGATPTTSTLTSASASLTPSAPVSEPSVPLSISSTSVSSDTATSPSATSSACPATLNGNSEPPHLLVPISSTAPNTAYGSQYSATVNATTATLINFDVPSADQGQTCTVTFFWAANGWATLESPGGIAVSKLAEPASQGTTFANAPPASAVGSIGSVQAGNTYIIASGPCAAGQTIGYRLDSIQGLALTYFQDQDPSNAMGLFLTVC